MAKLAVDVVLLPPEEIMEKAIKLNKKLLKGFDAKIVLNKKKCLPHISLAMGCIEEEKIPKIQGILKELADNFLPIELEVIGISASETTPVFGITKTKKLQNLHESVMEKMAPYVNYNPKKEMFFTPKEIENPPTLDYVRNFKEKSSFENFSPHITIGYGKLDNAKIEQIKSTANTLAVCQLGNYCTCRKVLIEVII